MPSRLHIILLTTLLTLVGLGIFWYKVDTLQFPITPKTNYKSWYIEASLNIEKSLKPATVELYLPPSQNGVLVSLEESIVTNNFGEQIFFDNQTGNRRLQLSKRRLADEESVLFRSTLVQIDSALNKQGRPPEAESDYSLQNRYKLDLPKNAPLYIAIDSLIDEATQRSADAFTFTTELFQSLKNSGDRTTIVLNSLPYIENTTHLGTFLLNTAGIPARLVNGIELTAAQRRTPVIQWVEVWLNDQWYAYLPSNNILQKRPKHYLAWWYGYKPLVQANGAKNIEQLISVKQNLDNSLTGELLKKRQEAFKIPTLHQLPIGTQLIFEVLLLIPIGGLVIAFLRQVVGLITFGTFMPVLIALAFRETGLLAGILSFSIVVGLGLLVRSYFHKLQLLLVPRLASVLTVTVLILIAFSLLMHAWGWTVGLSVSLFPIVIMAMVIERMALQWDEYGPQKAIYTGLGSLLAATISFYFMNLEIIGYLIFTFPELLFVILALTILLGRYGGYKLTEYYRFKAMEQ